MIDSRTAPYAALVLKHFTYTLPGTAQFLFGGAGRRPGALVAGIGTRWVALALVPILAGATWVHAANGWVFSAANGGWEYPVFLIAASLVAALLGDGRYALATLRPAPNLRVRIQ